MMVNDLDLTRIEQQIQIAFSEASKACNALENNKHEHLTIHLRRAADILAMLRNDITKAQEEYANHKGGEILPIAWDT